MPGFEIFDYCYSEYEGEKPQELGMAGAPSKAQAMRPTWKQRFLRAMPEILFKGVSCGTWMRPCDRLDWVEYSKFLASIFLYCRSKRKGQLADSGGKREKGPSGQVLSFVIVGSACPMFSSDLPERKLFVVKSWITWLDVPILVIDR